MQFILAIFEYLQYLLTFVEINIILCFYMTDKKKQERAIVHLEMAGKHYYYGNLKALTDNWSKEDIGVSYSYLKNLNISVDNPYRNDYCCIRRGVIVTSPKK